MVGGERAEGPRAEQYCQLWQILKTMQYETNGGMKIYKILEWTNNYCCSFGILNIIVLECHFGTFNGMAQGDAISILSLEYDLQSCKEKLKFNVLVRESNPRSSVWWVGMLTTTLQRTALHDHLCTWFHMPKSMDNLPNLAGNSLELDGCKFSAPMVISHLYQLWMWI